VFTCNVISIQLSAFNYKTNIIIFQQALYIIALRTRSMPLSTKIFTQKSHLSLFQATYNKSQTHHSLLWTNKTIHF